MVERQHNSRSKPQWWLALLTTTVLAAGCASSSTSNPPSSDARGTSTAAPSSVPTVLVLDASGSMSETDAPGPRIDAAKVAAHGLIDALPAHSSVALETYGTATSSDPAAKDAGCHDVTVLRPLGPLDRGTINAAIDRIAPSGYTPISLALQTAAGQLTVDNSPQAIVLVSDGEDTCDTPPCDTAAQLEEKPSSTGDFDRWIQSRRPRRRSTALHRRLHRRSLRSSCQRRATRRSAPGHPEYRPSQQFHELHRNRRYQSRRQDRRYPRQAQGLSRCRCHRRCHSDMARLRLRLRRRHP